MAEKKKKKSKTAKTNKSFKQAAIGKHISKSIRNKNVSDFKFQYVQNVLEII